MNAVMHSPLLRKTYLAFSIVVLFATYIIPGLDFQFHWSEVPLWLVLGSTGIVLCGYLMFFAAMNQNTYASRVVEVQDNQKVIETGLYAVVRHPMYLAGLILYGFSPLFLGSFVALIPMLFLPVLLVMRIRSEEKVLSDGIDRLQGIYEESEIQVNPVYLVGFQIP